MAGCDVERCSYCGLQRAACYHGIEHDRTFARWTGFRPGELESKALRISLNKFDDEGLYKVLFVKPVSKASKRANCFANFAAAGFRGHSDDISQRSSAANPYYPFRRGQSPKGRLTDLA
jgi:hypothetical protein